MSSKYHNGFYQVKNTSKYVGNKTPQFRSGWEHVFMRFCDENPAILQWASESIRIPYRNPFTNKNTVYVPDFMVVYVKKNGEKHAELIEVKPNKETSLDEAKSPRDQAAAVLNMHKWQAAQAWCDQHGLKFRIVTEHDIFHQGKAR